jgi:hypothetical protein
MINFVSTGYSKWQQLVDFRDVPLLPRHHLRLQKLLNSSYRTCMSHQGVRQPSRQSQQQWPPAPSQTGQDTDGLGVINGLA